MKFGKIAFEGLEDWIDASVVSLVAPSADGPLRPSLVISRDERGTDSFADYVAKVQKKFRGSVRGYKQLQEEQLEVSGKAAFWSIRQFQSPERIEVLQIELLVAESDTLVMSLSLTDSPENEKALKQRFEELLKSLVVE